VNLSPNKIKDILEDLYAEYNHRRLIKPDPLQFVYNYTDPADMEIAALLAAVLAYGRVQQIEKSLTNLFDRMSPSPFRFVQTFDSRKRNKLKTFKHRFNTGDDISDLLTLLKKVLAQNGSIENFFAQNYNPAEANIVPTLTKFCDSLYKMHGSAITTGLKYLLASPARGSVCKRLNLFLRWMVRDDNVDTGLWKSVDKAKLIVPVDVHMGRLTKILGFHDQKTLSLKTAVKITANFAKITPDDPVKYDFALSRIGILDNCTGRPHSRCRGCKLLAVCKSR